MISVTAAQLSAAAPSGNPAVIKAIADASGSVFAKYGVNSRARAFGFLSTALEESGFRTLNEDLRYTAPRLVQVWPNRFPNIAAAEPYAMQPAKLAEAVYGGRMGNTSPGDGFRYRGQGILQITGKSNFAILEKLTGLPLVAHPDMVTDPDHMLECAVALFVQYPAILAYCDQGNFTAVWALVGSGRANGPVINLANHQAALSRLSKAIPALVDVPPAPQPPPVAPAKPVPVPLPPDVPNPPPVAAPVALGWWGRLWGWFTRAA